MLWRHIQPFNPHLAHTMTKVDPTAVSSNRGSFGSLTTKSEYYLGTLWEDLMSPLILPITLATAGALGLIGMILALRVTMGRSKHNVIMGDGGNRDMIVRMQI